MYHVVSTGIAAIILYLISYFFCVTGFYSIQDHRKIWNTILAVIFIVAGAAGIFLALQITYKWNIPLIKTILKWHVEFGIALAFTALFHIGWHLSYFRRFSGKVYPAPDVKESEARSPSQNSMNLFIIGFISSSVQLLFIREIMNIAGGYELIAGTFLGSWLIGSAAGASMAGRSSGMAIRKINLIFASGPLISLLVLLTLTRLFLNPGETPSFFLGLILTLLSLFPFCFVSGFTLVRLINYSKSVTGYLPGKSFSIETTGGIVAGITVSLFTSGFLNTYQLLFIIIIINLAYILFSFFLKKRITMAVSGIIFALLSAVIILMNPDVFFRQQILHGINILSSRDTPYGNITTGTYGNEKSIYYNQRLQAYSADEMEREENIHYAMLQHNKPEKVLIISGDIKSNLKEIDKYDVRRVVFIERDPALIDPQLKKFASGSEILKIENKDAFRYIKKSQEDFDVVILLIPPPSTFLLNRFFTTEFFSEVKKRTGTSGVFVCSPGNSENYYSKESVVLFSSVFNSLKSVFRNVIPVAGNKLYFIASDSKISTDFCSLSEKKSIKNTYVGPDWMSDDLIAKKSAEIVAVMDRTVRQNTFAYPVACIHFQSYNLSKDMNEKVPALILIILIFVLPAFTIKRRNLVMFSSAAALAGFEIIILLTLQSAVGNMYMLTGMIIAALMTGLAVGSGFKIKSYTTWLLRGILLLAVIFYFFTALIINRLPGSASYLLSVLVLVALIFIPSLLTGLSFNLLTGIKNQNSDVSSVYSADLAGSAFGFLTVAAIAIPSLGIRMTIFLFAIMIFASILFGTLGNK
jgi:spermidine synthase